MHSNLSLLQWISPLQVNHTLYGLPLSRCRLFRPNGPHFFLLCIIDHPQNYINYDIRGFFPDNRVHTRVLPLQSRTSGCMNNPNPFGAFLDLDPTHMTPGLPYTLRLLGFDPSLSLVKLYKEPFGTLKRGRYREIEARKLQSIVARTLCLSLHPFVPQSTVVFFPSLPFVSKIAIEVMED